MTTLLTIVHVIVSVFLILVVLLQQGKSADWSGAFGGGGSQTAFGARGTATILSKATTAAAIIFMITSMALTILISRPSGGSVIREDATQQNAAPAQPPAGQQVPTQNQAAPAAPSAPATPAAPEK